MSPKKVLCLAVGATLWFAGITITFCALQRYSMSPGAAHAPDGEIDAFFATHRQPGRPLLVMAIHPLCPCTDASIDELGDLLARSHGSCDALLLQYHPLHGTPEWPVDTSPRKLGGIAVKVVLDPDGKIAATLGAETSGHVVFMDREGAVRFHGGLTIARGHDGRSPAQDAILEVLAGGRPTLNSAPVFGCALESKCMPAKIP
jgi:hypothetical protein